MTRMVSFRLNRECREITINPNKVVYVSHYENGASSIHFSKECFVRVQGEVSDVVRKIESGLNDGDFPAPTAPGTPSDELRRADVN